MPTENRSRNTEQMVRAPISLLERMRQRLIEMDQISDFGPELFNLLNRDHPPEQHQGETVKYLDLVSGNVFDDAEPIEQSGRRAIPIADAGEVERPSQIALSLQTKLKSVESERDRLRAKLAEQERSARELLRIIDMSVQGSAAYNRAVIAFHDSLNADTKPN